MENEKIETNAENNKNQQNSNSEVKPRNKKVTIVLVSVIIVLLIAIGVCVGLWFAGDTIKIINNKEEVVKEEEKNISKKIDETKPWVYIADYNKGKEEKTLTNNMGKVYNSAEEFKVPFININSEYAKTTNQEIQEMYETSYSEFGKNNEWITSLEYEVFENDNILSIVITKGQAIINGGGNSEKFTYNFNLDTLEKATLEEMYKLCGFESESEFQNKKSIAIKNYESDGPELQKVDDKYYIDESKKINVIIEVLAAGRHQNGLVIDKNAEVKENNVNSEQVNNENISQNSTNNNTSQTNENKNSLFDGIIDENIKNIKIADIKDGSWDEYNIKNIDLQNLKSIATILKSSSVLTENRYPRRLYLSEEIIINYNNGYELIIEYDDDSNMMDVVLFTPNDGSADTWWIMDYEKVNEIKNIVKQYKSTPKFSDYFYYNSTQFSVKIPKDWDGKYVFKEERALDKGVIRYNFYTKDSNMLIFGIVLTNRDIHDNLNTKNLQEVHCSGIMSIGNAGGGKYDYYFTTVNTELPELNGYKEKISLISQSVKTYWNADNIENINKLFSE